MWRSAAGAQVTSVGDVRPATTLALGLLLLAIFAAGLASILMS
jgi:hypothetical protein